MSTLQKTNNSSPVQAKPPISRQEMALLYSKGEESYWVRGYELFDPDVEHCTNKGYQPLKTKALRPGHAFVINKGQQGKPCQYELSRLSVVKPGKQYFTFQEVFGGFASTGIAILDIETDDGLDDDVADLSLGLTTTIDVEPEAG